MKPVVVTPSTAYPVSITEAMDHCRVTDHGESGYLNSLIARATRYAESYLGRRFITTRLRASWDAFPDTIRPPQPPFKTLVSLTYVNSTGGTATLCSTLTSTAIRIDSDSEPARIDPAYGTTWPATREVTRAVQLTYDAGYAATSTGVPETIRHAILLLVGHWYENREPVVMDAIPKEVPLAVDSLLNMEHYGRLYDSD